MSGQKNNNQHTVLISLGSNINPEKHLPAAVKLLAEIVDGLQVSSTWESPAVGSIGPNYLNNAVLFRTGLSLEKVRSHLITPIENQLGRVRSGDKYMDRTIDLDVLIYDQNVVDPDLWSQAHLAVPTSELIPDFKNETTGDTLREIAERLQHRVEINQRVDLD